MQRPPKHKQPAPKRFLVGLADSLRGWHNGFVRKTLWAMLAFLLLSLVLTWPLAAQFSTHVPGDGIDDPSLAWNLWWAKHALVDQPQNPFISAWQFWPVGINLAFYTLTLLNGLLSVPLQVVFGLIPAYNILLLSSFVLSGLGAYLLCLEFLRGDNEKKGDVSPAPRLLVSFASFLGGALYAFASAKLFYAALGQGNIASSQWAPFAALYLVRAARPQGRPRDAALAALFLVLQAYAELTYASFLLIFAALVVGWGVFGAKPVVSKDAHSALTQHSSHSTQHAALMARLLLLALLFAVGISPILANMVPDLRAEGDFFTSGGGFADIFSADLAGYAIPTQLHPVLGRVIRAWSNDSVARPDGSHFPVNKGQQVYIGYGALALVAVGLWHGRRRGQTWFWAAAALLFFLLTLGPNLRIAGHDTGLPLPFRLIAQLPFFKGNRYPSRYSVLLLLSLAPLVAAGARHVIGRLKTEAPRSSKLRASYLMPHAARFALLLAILIFEHLSAPLPTFDLRVPALYDRLSAETGDFALLELPLGWRNGARVAGKKDIIIMQQLWYQSQHGKRLLGGNTSRNPEFKFQYFSEDPTLARLIAAINAADMPPHDALRAALAARPIAAADRAQARAWAATLNIRYVMVHHDKLSNEVEATVRDLLPLELVASEGALSLYRVAETTPPPDHFEPGTDEGRIILAEGWSPPTPAQTAATGEPAPVYAQRAEAHLLLPIGPAATQLRLRVGALTPGQRVTLTVDGRALAAQPLPETPAWLTFTLPAAPSRPALSTVQLHFAQVTPVAEVAQRLSRAGPAALLVRSAGEETGNFGHIYVNGVEQSPNSRGYNLVALAPADGRIVSAAGFDTHADSAAGTRLADWIRALPPGTWVAGAAKDEAAMQLDQAAIDAFASLGVTVDLRGHFRWGHAFIGQVGAAAHTALEASDGVRPAQVSYGLPLSAPAVAATLFEVEIVK